MGYLLILAIILLGGALATLGDRVGSRVGKARLSLFNLRPKKTAILITILTGSLISASTMGILLATSRQFRDAVFRIGEIRRQLQDKREQQRQLLQERAQVLQEKERSEDELAIARAELTESIRRLRTVNRSLRTAQQRQRKSADQLKQLQTLFRQERQKLQQAKTQETGLRSKIQSLSAEELRLQSERQRLLLQRNQTQARLSQVEAQRQAAEAAVGAARSQLQQANQQLSQADQKLLQANQQLGQAERQLGQANQQLQEANQQRTALLEQRAQLQQDIWSLEQGLQQANQQLQEANQQRTALLEQQTQLRQDIRSLEQERQQLARNLEKLLLGIRLGNVAIRPGQVLAFAVFEGSKNRTEIWAQLNQLVRQARTNAIILTNPPELTANDQVIRFQPNTINRLVTQLSDGQAYVVRFLAAANYLEGEDSVLVIPQVAPHRLVFNRNTAIATLTLTPSTLSEDDILQQLQGLFQAVNQRAIQAGVLPDPTTRTVGTFQQIDLFRFVLALKQRNDNTPITIEAITTKSVFSSGPLLVNLVARQNGAVILRAR